MGRPLEPWKERVGWVAQEERARGGTLWGDAGGPHSLLGGRGERGQVQCC